MTEKSKPNGPAVAAILSAMIGLLVLGIVHTVSEASEEFGAWLLSVGKLWIPGAQGIGPYSGKETFMLISWLLSWVVLYAALRKRNVNLIIPTAIFTIGMGLATLLIYTPFIDLLLGK